MATETPVVTNPKKSQLISTFPIGQSKCRVRRAAYDAQKKVLYVVLSEATSEDIYASIQIYRFDEENGKFIKEQEPLKAGRIGGVLVLGNGNLAVTLMAKDPKKIRAIQLKPFWEAYIITDTLNDVCQLKTEGISQPGQNDSWCLSNNSESTFFIASPDFTKIHEYAKDGNPSCIREISCVKLANMESIHVIKPNKTIITIHRDKAHRWVDRMKFAAWIHRISDNGAKQTSKIEDVDQGMITILTPEKIMFGRRKALWDTLDLLCLELNNPDNPSIVDTPKLGLVRPVCMVGNNKLLITTEDKKDTKFGLLKLVEKQ